MESRLKVIAFYVYSRALGNPNGIDMEKTDSDPRVVVPCTVRFAKVILRRLDEIQKWSQEVEILTRNLSIQFRLVTEKFAETTGNPQKLHIRDII